MSRYKSIKDITVPKAKQAETADKATSADKATTATSATTANSATTATSANSATNATTATKANQLTTSRSLWGRSFNGTADISGALSNVGNITPSSAATYTIGTSNVPFKYVYVSDEIQLKDGGVSFSDSGKTYSSFQQGILYLKHDTARINFHKTTETTIGYPTARIGINSNEEIEFYDRTAGWAYFNSTRVAIGTATRDTSYYLYCGGKIYCTSLTGSTSSDIRLKENISENDYIQKLLKLGDVVDYNYTKEAIDSHEGLDSTRHTGLIYQNITGTDIPNLAAEDEDGHGIVNYYSPDLIATMIGAIQQLSKKVETLEEELRVLKSEE